MPSKIEWTEESWNPVTGCTPISEGCVHCYARRMATRLRGRAGYPAQEPFRVTKHRDKLQQPRRWRRPRRVFVCSMGDLFHPEVDFSSIRDIYETAREHPRHTYIFLTKRPHRMHQFTEYMLRKTDLTEIWGSNMWIGVTAENHERARERVPVLLSISARVRFVSIEPMLGPVRLRHLDVEKYHSEWCHIDALTGAHTDMGRPCESVPKLDWVICGGETGPGARPMSPEWAQELLWDCVTAHVPFFFKRHGSYNERAQGEAYVSDSANTGRLLKGLEWNQYPNS